MEGKNNNPSQKGIVDREQNSNTPGTTESFGSAFCSSLIMLFILWLSSFLFFWGLDIEKESAEKMFRSMMSENFGLYSFVCASLLTIAGNSACLIAKCNPSFDSYIDRFRLHVQSYLVGLMGTVFTIGFFGLDTLEYKDYIWTLIIIILVFSTTILTNFLKVRLNKKFSVLVGGLYIIFFILTLTFAKQIFECLSTFV
ncbi:hypothetical protein HJ078_22490 [Vibrio parahaemolyticus]|nr:hypothetical protein [Vibrio parahaemolyticus]MBE4240899.1 hypothetical protein [Vibrio parahaemolyticus]HCH6427313.1 hypothetical protein [Vibrio parahaemolyticus]